MNNPYLDLTRELNQGRLRALLSSGQAVAASEDWAKVWPDVQRQIEGLPLPDAHRLMVSRAEGVLPFEPAQGAES
jgi:hypothetical protein